MNRKQLSKELAKNSDLSQRKAENLIIAFGSAITDALEKGEKVVYSNFGTFYTVHYPSKTIYHPKLGKKKTMVMLPTNAAKWMPAPSIKKAVNNGKAPEGIVEHKATKKSRHSSRNSDQNVSEKEASTKSVEDGEESFDIPVNVKRSKKQAPTTKGVEVPTKSVGKAKNEDIVDEDDIEQYEKELQNKQDKKEDASNIYEEILGDGSKEITTSKGSIKAYKKDAKKKPGPFSFLSKMGKKDEAKVEKPKKEEVEAKEEKPGKVSLADAGIFSPQASKDRVEKPIPTDKQANANEQKIDKIKNEFKKPDKKEEPKTEEENKSVNNDSLPQKKKEEALSPTVFDKVNISYRDLSKTTVPKELLARLPEKIAKKSKAVPIEDKDGKITVAMIDPEDVEAKEIIKRSLGGNIEIALATEADINHVLSQYQGLESEVSEAVESAESDDEESKKNKKRKTKQEIIDEASDDAPAARIVTSLLKRAIRDKASDVHIEPTEKEVAVRFRLDGVLKKKVSLPKDIQSAVVSRIKILSNLKIDEQRLPQDGRFNITVDNRRVDFRVSSMPIANGEKVVMRILDKETGILTIEQLGVRGSGVTVLEEQIKKSHGMILVTGPTGSGKTTTLYAIIDKLFSDGVNIVTLEDPIEYQLKGVNQSQVNSDIGFTFSSGLRSLVRQDPDIIMLGEIRDGETADMAVHAALTGHVVLSTLHTNDAAGAMPRLVDMDVEPFLLTSSVNTIVGQRLGRKICEECKEEIKITAEEKTKIDEEIEKMPEKEKAEAKKKTVKFMKGKGCKNCDNTGYKGRVGLYEVLAISEEIKDLILKRVSSSQIQQKAIEQGMVTMLQDGILKAMDGITSMEEVWRVTKD